MHRFIQQAAFELVKDTPLWKRPTALLRAAANQGSPSNAFAATGHIQGTFRGLASLSSRKSSPHHSSSLALAKPQQFYQNHQAHFRRHFGAGPSRSLDKLSLFAIAITTALSALRINQIWQAIGRNNSKKDEKRDKILILGSGWGGLSAAQHLDTSRYDVQLISPRPSFLLTPLLVDALTGKIQVDDATEPINHFFSRTHTDIEYTQGSTTNIDHNKKTVTYLPAGARRHQSVTIPYDKLIIAVGNSAVDQIPGCGQHTFALNSEDEVRMAREEISRRIAESRGKSEDELKNLLNFVIVASNAVGIELASGLHKLLDSYKEDFPEIENATQITLVMHPDNTTNIYEQKIQKYYQEKNQDLLQDKVKFIELTSGIQKVEEDELVVSREERIPFGVCFWVKNPENEESWIKDFKKRIPEQRHPFMITTGPYLAVMGTQDVYAIGSCATLDQKRLKDRLKKVFAKLDTDGNGTLDREEFEQLFSNKTVSMRKYPQLEPWRNMAEQLFLEADENKDGVLSESEFEKILEKIDSRISNFPRTAGLAFQQGKYIAESLNSVLGKRELEKLFRELDSDNSGELDEPEVRAGLKKLGLPCSKKKVAEFMSLMDTDNSGTIDLNEFMQFVLETQYQGSAGDWKKLAHHKILPFRYKHLGGYEYVGYEYSVTERRSQGSMILDGFGAWWLWKSAVFSRVAGVTESAKRMFLKSFRWIWADRV